MVVSRSRSKHQLNRIYTRDAGICQHCMEPCNREDASRGHIVDVKYCVDKEQARSDDNIQLEHIWCNRAKDSEYQQTVSNHLHTKIGDYIAIAEALQGHARNQ